MEKTSKTLASKSNQEA